VEAPAVEELSMEYGGIPSLRAVFYEYKLIDSNQLLPILFNSYKKWGRVSASELRAVTTSSLLYFSLEISISRGVLDSL